MSYHEQRLLEALAQRISRILSETGSLPLVCTFDKATDRYSVRECVPIQLVIQTRLPSRQSSGPATAGHMQEDAVAPTLALATTHA